MGNHRNNMNKETPTNQCLVKEWVAEHTEELSNCKINYKTQNEKSSEKYQKTISVIPPIHRNFTSFLLSNWYFNGIVLSQFCCYFYYKNYTKFSTLNQHKYGIIQFCRSEARCSLNSTFQLNHFLSNVLLCVFWFQNQFLDPSSTCGTNTS